MQLLSLAALPLTLRFADRLFDHGYALSKGLGLVITCYLTFVLAHGIMPFSSSSVSISAALLAIVSIIGVLIGGKSVFAIIRGQKRCIILYELIFLVSFAVMLAVRSLVPNITSVIQDSAAEKFTDFAVLNGLLTSRYFPPHDAWLSGANLNYYYFGHFMWACLIKLGNWRPEIGFNLALASVFAYVCILAFSLGYNLTRRIRYGFLALFLIALSSNLDGLLQLISIAQNWMSGTLPRGSHWYAAYDYWRSSRAIENTINEFPAFSFLLGDLHAHLSSLLIFLSGLLLLLQVWRGARFHRSLFQYEIWHLDELFISAIIAGALYAANSWDAITFGALFACVIFSARPLTRASRQSHAAAVTYRFAFTIESLLLTAVILVLGVQLLFRFFVDNFTPPFQSDVHLTLHWPFLKIAAWPLRAVEVSNRSSPIEFFVHWVLLAILPVAFLTSLLRRKNSADSNTGYRRPALIASTIAIVFVLFTVTSGWVASTMFTAALVLAVLLLVQHQPPAIRLLLCFAFVFCVLTCFCELFYLDDIFSGPIERINTVFKIYYGLWPVAVCCTILSLRRISRYGRHKVFARCATAALLFCGGVYPIVGLAQRVDQSLPFRPAVKTARLSPLQKLDGLQYLKWTQPDDYAAIMWVRSHTAPDAHLLESTGRQYEYNGRFGTLTGRSAFGGWLYHEWGWRGDAWAAERDRRISVAQQIYLTADPAKAYRLLQHDNIDYIILGDQERISYGALNESKFQQIATEVFRRGGTVIYKVLADAHPQPAPAEDRTNWKPFVEEKDFLSTAAVSIETTETQSAPPQQTESLADTTTPLLQTSIELQSPVVTETKF
jgi:YYY domain-containing protein